MLDLYKNARLKYFLLLFNLFIFILLMYTWDRPGYLVNITFWSVPRTKDTQRAFFQKIWTFGLGQTFWSEIFLGIWGIFGRTKGQIISKGLFGVLEFSQKTNEQIRHSSKNEFVCSFFGRIRGCQKSFRNYLTFKSNEKCQVQSTELSGLL